jgi:Predicted metal-dependent membrane protease
MSRIKGINIVFFLTVVTAVLGSQLIGLLNINNYFISIIISQVLLIIPMLSYVIITKQNILELIRFHKIKPVNVGLAILFAYLITPLMTLLNAISLLFSKNVIEDVVTKVVADNPLPLSLLVVAFIPCVFEESVYRGCFFNEYRKVNPKKAILLSGFLFGLMHMNVNQFIYAFAMGVIFALMVEATDSILITMIIHFTINGNSVLVTYMLPRMRAMMDMVYGDKATKEMLSQNAASYSPSNLLPVIFYYMVIAAFTTTLAFLLFRLMANIEGRWDHVRGIFGKNPEFSYSITNQNSEMESIIDNKGKLITFPLIVGIVICIGVMIWGQLGN